MHAPFHFTTICTPTPVSVSLPSIFTYCGTSNIAFTSPTQIVRVPDINFLDIPAVPACVCLSFSGLGATVVQAPAFPITKGHFHFAATNYTQDCGAPEINFNMSIMVPCSPIGVGTINIEMASTAAVGLQTAFFSYSPDAECQMNFNMEGLALPCIPFNPKTTMSVSFGSFPDSTLIMRQNDECKTTFDLRLKLPNLGVNYNFTPGIFITQLAHFTFIHKPWGLVGHANLGYHVTSFVVEAVGIKPLQVDVPVRYRYSPRVINFDPGHVAIPGVYGAQEVATFNIPIFKCNDWACCCDSLFGIIGSCRCSCASYCRDCDVAGVSLAVTLYCSASYDLLINGGRIYPLNFP
jgi:hypothetical protein